MGSVASVALSREAAYASSGDMIVRLAIRDGSSVRFAAPGPIQQIAPSGDGRWLSACTTDGDVLAWSDPGDHEMPRTFPIESPRGSPRATTVAFADRGEGLISGDQDGGIRRWAMSSGRPEWRIAPHRGKVEALSASKDGRFLVQVDHDRAARIWDLREGRSLRRIPGEWTDADYLPDGSGLAMTRRDGEVVVIDAATNAERPARFARPRGDDGMPITWDFGRVCASPDGRLVAAGSLLGPVACVWPVGGGAPLATIRDHDEPIAEVAFADDSRHWLTASLDGSAKVWAVGGDTPRWVLRLDPGNDPDADPAVTAARFAPGGTRRAVTAHRDGRVVLWELLDGGQARAIPIGRFDGEARAVAFSADGQRLIGSGADKTVRHWDVSGPLPPPPATRLEPQHTEQVNALAVWPDGRLLASAGDDGAIRFWKGDGSAPVGRVATNPDDGTWVAFDPEGRFDSAPGGEAQVSFLRSDRVLTLGQYAETGRVFGLGSYWLDGKSPPGTSPLLANRPAGLALDAPLDAGEQDDAEVIVHVGDASPESLRLYLNDQPVREAEDFRPAADPATRTVRVALVPGENRLVAMGSRAEPGAVSGRSNVVTIVGPPPDDAARGVIHTLALGVGAYDANRLPFAVRDAVDLAQFLETHGVGSRAKIGLSLVLKDAEVRPEAVEKALLTIRRHARPEDAVVIFLAGHTDIRRDRFCLLLDKFPFAAAPLAPGQRGPIGPAIDGDASMVLPYASIYRILSRMDARKRLVVIDACQAGAVFDDPSVRRIREKADAGAHHAGTSYLLAARRGESANESAALEHGLFTHLLLRGMGADGLKPEPGGLLGDADADGDREVTTEELRQFLDIQLPRLAARLPEVAARAKPLGANAPAAGVADPTRVEGATVPFPIAKLRGKK